MRLALAAILTVATATGAWAQSGDAGWPAKQAIRMIVPLQAGSAVDIVARLISTRLSERLKQTIVVDNR